MGPNHLHSILWGPAVCVPTSSEPPPHCFVKERERKRERREKEGERESERKSQRCLNPSLWTGPAIQRRPRGEFRPAVHPSAPYASYPEYSRATSYRWSLSPPRRAYPGAGPQTSASSSDPINLLKRVTFLLEATVDRKFPVN